MPCCFERNSVMNTKIEKVLQGFGLDYDAYQFGNGHINDTYLTVSDPKYVVQRINKNVFPHPVEVMENIIGVTEHIAEKVKKEGGDPERATLKMLSALDGKPYYMTEDGEYYRAYKFVDKVVSCDSVDDNRQLYEAAKAFGKFQNMLADYPAEKLHETIVDFHNTVARYSQFKEALENNRSGRACNAPDEIKFVLDREKDASVVVDAIADGRIPLRVTHNDTKLNNVLLDEKTGEGVCVIDLDTVMPGSLLYDYGDALRFGASSGAEDEKDLSKIWFCVDKFEAFTKGFIEALPTITDAELELLPFSIKLMTLECGARFLADYLNGDTYFKTKYPEHNLVRARTQFKLVKEIEDKMDELNAIVHKIAGR